MENNRGILTTLEIMVFDQTRLHHSRGAPFAETLLEQIEST
jgi:hypothetical protein